MLQRQLLKEIHGCISTGKEANVYHAITESGDHRAIKGKVLNQQIFMTLQSGMRLFSMAISSKTHPALPFYWLLINTCEGKVFTAKTSKFILNFKSVQNFDFGLQGSSQIYDGRIQMAEIL